MCDRPATARPPPAEERERNAPRPKSSPRVRHAKRNVPDVVSETTDRAARSIHARVSWRWRGRVPRTRTRGARRRRRPRRRAASSAPTAGTSPPSSPSSACRAPAAKNTNPRARGRDALERGAVRRDPRRRDARRPEETSRRARGVPDARRNRADSIVNRPRPRPRPRSVRPRRDAHHRRVSPSGAPRTRFHHPPRTPRARPPDPRVPKSDARARKSRRRRPGTTGRRARRPPARRRSFPRPRRSSSAEGYDLDARGASRRCFASEERGGDAFRRRQSPPRCNIRRRRWVGEARRGRPRRRSGRRGTLSRGDAGGGVRGEGCVGSGRDDEVDDGVLGGGEFYPVEDTPVAHGERGETEHKERRGANEQRTVTASA